jgi:hypothetical protein
MTKRDGLPTGSGTGPKMSSTHILRTKSTTTVRKTPAALVRRKTKSDLMTPSTMASPGSGHRLVPEC